MKIQALIFMACCTVAGSAQAASDFELKGLRIGMSEAQFKALNPKARCSKGYRDAALDKVTPPMPSLRTCSVAGYSVAAKDAKSTQFVFYGDQLGHMLYTFHAEDARALQAAFTEKYGKPTLDAARSATEWEFTNSTSLRLRCEPGDIVYLFVDSKHSLDYLMREKEIEKHKAQKDL